jgi:hypothetical protein
MTQQVRSRRAGIPRELAKQRPLYARILGLQYLTPSGLLCFAFLEGAITLGVLLALAELVSWWGVLVLPLTVAAMVKLNDVIAGAVSRPAVPTTTRPPLRQRTGGTTSSREAAARRAAALRPPTMQAPTPPVAIPHPAEPTTVFPAPVHTWTSRPEELDATRQRARQTASRRYE